jgi:predicted nucleic acid-binding protein
MRVVDTSLWIEYLVDGQLADIAGRCILPMQSCIVPAMVQFELFRWTARQPLGEQTKVMQTILTECASAIMDSIVASDAAAAAATYKLHATDAIIYATARLHDAPLFTCDAHFKGLPGVEYFEKS